MNRFIFRLVSVFLVGALSACSLHVPQTPAEVRAYDGIGKDAESFTVNRPFNAVKSSLITQSKKCLNIKVSQSHTSNQGGGSATWDYHPKIQTTKKGVSLVLQKDLVGGNMVMLGDTPPGGMYAFVLDATPITSKTTKIDFHQFSGIMWDNEYDAIMAWVKKGSTACPAL